MNAKTLILLALQLAIMGTVFTYGLQAKRDDLLYVVQRPRLLVRSILAVLVIMPLMVGGCVYFLDLPQSTAVVLTALAIAPVPPLLPQKQENAGRVAPFGLGLLVVLALVSIVTAPLSTLFLDWLFALPLTMAPGAITKIVLKMIIAPLAAGVLVTRLAPRAAQHLLAPVRRIANVLLIGGVLVLLAGTWHATWSAIGQWTVVALATFVLAGLLIGHWMGRPERAHESVLALASASRHPAIALALASANFPDAQFAPTLVLYLILCTLLTVPYVKWQRRRSA